MENSKEIEDSDEIENSKEQKRALSTIEFLQSKLKDGVLKGHSIEPLLNIETLELVGISVKLRLNTRFTYTSTILDDWKEMFGAHEYAIFVNHRVLYVKFKVHFNPQA